MYKMFCYIVASLCEVCCTPSFIGILKCLKHAEKERNVIKHTYTYQDDLNKGIILLHLFPIVYKAAKTLCC